MRFHFYLFPPWLVALGEAAGFVTGTVVVPAAFGVALFVVVVFVLFGGVEVVIGNGFIPVGF